VTEEFLEERYFVFYARRDLGRGREEDGCCEVPGWIRIGSEGMVLGRAGTFMLGIVDSFKAERILYFFLF